MVHSFTAEWLIWKPVSIKHFKKTHLSRTIKSGNCNWIKMCNKNVTIIFLTITLIAQFPLSFKECNKAKNQRKEILTIISDWKERLLT
jgi:hypothetical protein